MRRVECRRPKVRGVALAGEVDAGGVEEAEDEGTVEEDGEVGGTVADVVGLGEGGVGAGGDEVADGGKVAWEARGCWEGREKKLRLAFNSMAGVLP